LRTSGSEPGLIGITGTPGTGKKSVSVILGRNLGLDCVSLNEVYLPKSGVVDPEFLKNAVRARFRSPAVVYGHLLPYSVPARMLRRVVVLRCDPMVLKDRLKSRGYDPGKVRDNVEAELIGVVSADAHKAFGRKASELDTTRLTPETAAFEAEKLVRRGRQTQVDWTLSYDTAPKLRSLIS
jgi:adenylate kinase